MTRQNEKLHMIGNMEVKFWFDSEEECWHASLREWKGSAWSEIHTIQSLRKKLAEDLYKESIVWAESLLKNRGPVESEKAI